MAKDKAQAPEEFAEAPAEVEAPAAAPKGDLVTVNLPFPVQINGVDYPEGEVEVAPEIAEGLQDVLDGVAEKASNDAALQEAAKPEEE